MARTSRCVLLGILLGTWCSFAWAQRGVRLNGDLPHKIVGNVLGDADGELEISPDGAWVVFRSDGEVAGSLELYRAPLAGGAPPVKLSAPIQSNERVEDFELSPDGARVVYLVSPTPVINPRIYSVPLDGSSAAVLLDSTPGSVGEFAISDDATTVAFTNGGMLKSVPIDGSSPPLVLGQHVRGGGIYPSIAIRSGTGRIVFVSRLGANSTQLLSVPVDGGSAPVQLSPPLTPYGNINIPRITPDGSRVLFLASLDVQNILQLYSSPIDGSAPPVPLNGALVTGG